MPASSWAVALVVKVSPSTSAGATWPVATSHTTRAAMTRGLARPGAGDHHGRGERGRDRRELLVAEGEVRPHQLAQLVGGVDAERGHESTDPAAWAGQIGTNAQR